MRRRPPGGLMALSPGNLGASSTKQFVSVMRACVAEAGLRSVLLREPQLPDAALLILLHEICALREDCAELWVAVHDRPHLALAAGADAVHLGFRSLRVNHARRVVDDRCAIGLSTHAGDRGPHWDQADYLFHGPVHDTPSKRGLVEPVGMAGLADFCARSPLPVWGIGGLSPGDAVALREHGACGAAVLRGVACSENPVQQCRDWNAAWPADVESGA